MKKQYLSNESIIWRKHRHMASLWLKSSHAAKLFVLHEREKSLAKRKLPALLKA